MKTLELQDAIGSLAEYVRAVGQEPVIVSLKGKPVAALISIENADWETATLSTNPEFLALIRRSRIRQEKEGGLSSVELRRRLAQASKGLTRHASDRRQKRGGG
ncbi:MAG: type II toxin-antitoxin system Phd/YefM family antitoxin [Acidobacteria bacterium]|nr:type II toxin-antitoxin system Phd/YefM family antitoxin [Acidobacteriota bacterium]MCI0717411.1 type II toxin-antitoxin system Phd/YefM family antitoxin [Acidobacteriota bacterium]